MESTRIFLLCRLRCRAQPSCLAAQLVFLLVVALPAASLILFLDGLLVGHVPEQGSACRGVLAEAKDFPYFRFGFDLLEVFAGIEFRAVFLGR